MTDWLPIVLSGMVSGAFSAGVIWSGIRATARTAKRMEGKMDKHIDDHLKGVFR